MLGNWMCVLSMQGNTSIYDDTQVIKVVILIVIESLHSDCHSVTKSCN